MQNDRIKKSERGVATIPPPPRYRANATFFVKQVMLISKCKEFSDVKLRINEKRILNTLNKDKNKETIR